MIPVSEPHLTEQDVQYAMQAVRSGWVSSAGEFIDRFEDGWARFCGRRYGVAVTNGTHALQLAVACLDLAPGDEVIVPSFTIISCVLAVLENGGTPVLADVDPHTWCLDVEQVEQRITPRTRAIMPVHMYGHPADMDAVVDVAQRYGLAIVEDAAQAHGAEYLCQADGTNPTWRRCGSFGKASCFSFYANKLITTGEGGMLVTDDAQIADRARLLRNLGFSRERRFLHDQLGSNFRLTNLQASLGVAQLERVEELVARKRWIGAEYTRRLQGATGVQLPVEMPWARSIFWMYGLVISEEHGIDAAELARRLSGAGIETRPFFLGMHEQPALRCRGLFVGEEYSVTERLARRGLYLPSGTTLRQEQIEFVCNAVREALA